MVRILHHSDSDGLLGAMGVSVLLHVVIVLLVVLGLPIFWEPEVLPGAVGIELAELSDITAAPVPQQLGPPKEQPKPEPPKPEVKKEAPKKEASPPPAPKPAAAPPPPPAEEVAEAIPDPEAEKKKEEDKKKEEEKKKKEEEKKKKKEEEKKKKEEAKKQKQEDEALNDLLSSVLQETPAPEPDKKPEKKANPEPAEPTTGELTENASPVRLTASQEDGYRRQLIPNWNFDAGIANPENYVVTVRIDLAPDGTVLRAEIQDTSRMSDPVFRSVAETARRAPLKLGRFDVRPGETVPPQIDIVFDLAKAINGSY